MKRLTPTLLLAATMIAGTARADSLTLTFVAGLGNTVNVAAPGRASQSVIAGPYSYDLSKSTQPPINSSSKPQLYDGFCIDFNDTIAPKDSATFQVESLTSYNEGSKIQGLLYQYALAADPSNPLSALTNPVKGVDADALSIAIWEVETEKAGGTGLINTNAKTDLTVSGFSDGMTSQIVSLANTWLADLTSSTVEKNQSDVEAYALVDNAWDPLQAQCVVVGFVPEPAAYVGLAGMGLMGLAIGGVVALRKRGPKLAA